MTSILTATALTVALGEKNVLSDIDLDLAPGRITVVLGENGSGKSTLIHVLAGLIRARHGDVHLGGRALASYAPLERAGRIGCVLQETTLDFDFSLRDVVALGAPPSVPPVQADQRVTDAVERLDLSDVADRLWSRLSGGERQRGHLARLLVGRAEILLLDEPQNHLDLAARVRLRSALHGEAARGAAVLFTTHDLEEASWADDLLVLRRGQAVAQGTPAAVLTAPTIERCFDVRTRTLDDPEGGMPGFRLLTSDRR